MILTNAKGIPFPEPEPPPPGAPIEDKIAFLRAFAARNDAISDAANKSFEKALRNGLR